MNVQGISNKINDLEAYVALENPDILSVAEHWCNPLEISFMNLQGYVMAASYCRPSRQHGGVAIYIKSNLEFENIPYISKFSLEMQCELCAIRLKHMTKNICVVSVYRPPYGSLEIFSGIMTYVLDYCLTGPVSIFTCGDLNINFFEPHSCLDYLLLEFDLGITSEDATRVYTNKRGITSSTKIDYILTNVHRDLVTAKVVDSHIGDHRTIILSFACPVLKSVEHTIFRTFRCLSETNLENLSSMAASVCFDGIYREANIERAFEFFYLMLQNILDTTCPIVQKRCPISPKGGWISKEVRQSSRKLKDLHWLFLNLKSIESRNMYLAAKKEYQALLKTTKLNFHNNLLHLSNNKNKTIWQLVRKEIGPTKQNNNIFHITSPR